MNIKDIINYLDNYLTYNRIQSIEPVEANALLDKVDLLKDRDGKGKPLRVLLRKGLLPHAYQPSGKRSRWTIPHSKSLLVKPINKIENPHIENHEKNKVRLSKAETIDMLELKKQLEKARLKYKPDDIKYLLIAQAPPDSIDRFFYYEDVRNHDHLFLGVAQALFPYLKNDFSKFRKMDGEKSMLNKKQILEKFQSKKFYLLDLSELPIGNNKGKAYLKAQIPNLIQKIKSVSDNNPKIILIKVDVYDIAFKRLIEAGFENVINYRIHFPAQGGQTKFQFQFKEALKLADYQ